MTNSCVMVEENARVGEKHFIVCNMIDSGDRIETETALITRESYVAK